MTEFKQELKDPLVQAEGQQTENINPDTICDPSSTDLVRRLPAIHKSGLTCQNVVRQSQHHLINECRYAMSVMKDRLTIHELVASLLNYDEKVLNDGKELDFHTMTWRPVGLDRPSQTHPEGKLIITNQRLLCVSSSFIRVMSVGQVGNPKLFPKVQPSYYTIDHECLDRMWFFPIPIKNFQHFSLLAKAGTEAAHSVEPIAPGCFGWCPCLCLKGWRSSVYKPRIDVNQRILTLSCYFPPWNEKYTFEVHISPNLPLVSVRNWIAVFNQSVRAAQDTPEKQPLPKNID